MGDSECLIGRRIARREGHKLPWSPLHASANAASSSSNWCSPGVTAGRLSGHDGGGRRRSFLAAGFLSDLPNRSQFGGHARPPKGSLYEKHLVSQW